MSESIASEAFLQSTAESLNLVRDEKLMAIVEAYLLDADAAQPMSRAQLLALERLSLAVEKLRDFLDARAARAKQKQIRSIRRPIKKVPLLYSPSNLIVSAFKAARRVKAFTEELDHPASKRNQLGKMLRMPLETVSQTQGECIETGPLTCREVIGRDQGSDNIIRMLYQSSRGQDTTSVLTVVQMEGVGKTSLAQLVLDDRANHFNLTLWTVILDEVVHHMVVVATNERCPIQKILWLYSTSNLIVSAFKDARRVKAFIEELDHLASKHNQLGNMLRMPLETVSQTQTECVETGPLTCEEVIDRHQDRDKIVSMLLQSSRDQETSVIAIVGFGGIGKCTLAQYVYNDGEPNYCNVTIWTVNHLVNKMSQVAQLRYWLHSITSRKKFLPVLDNNWDRFAKVPNPLGQGQEDHDDDDDDDDDDDAYLRMRPSSQLAGKVCVTCLPMLCHSSLHVEQKLNGRLRGMSLKQQILRTPKSPDSFQKYVSMDEWEEDYGDNNDDQLKPLAVTKSFTTPTPIQTRDFRVGNRKTKKEDKVEETEDDNQSFNFLMSFSLAASCLMLCLLPLISDEEVMSGTFLVLEPPNTIMLSASLTLAATTSLLSVETMPRRPKFAHSCGFFAILSLFFALAVLLYSFLLHPI